jgi:hypothetical protein
VPWRPKTFDAEMIHRDTLEMVEELRANGCEVTARAPNYALL